MPLMILRTLRHKIFISGKDSKTTIIDYNVLQGWFSKAKP
jgi:hypothetical protein